VVPELRLVAEALVRSGNHRMTYET
jgi:hypothetical protein